MSNHTIAISNLDDTLMIYSLEVRNTLLNIYVFFKNRIWIREVEKSK